MSSGRGRGGQSKKSKPRDGGNGWGQWGGYMEAKKQKLQDQFLQQQPSVKGSTSNIFQGIAIFVNGYTYPPADELKRLMLQHGGQFHHYYSRDRTTHIVAINLPNSKIAQLTTQKVVHPDWVTNSIKEGKLLPYQDYQLYSAKSTIQPALKFKPTAAATSAAEDGEGEKDETEDVVTSIPASDSESDTADNNSASFTNASNQATVSHKSDSSAACVQLSVSADKPPVCQAPNNSVPPPSRRNTFQSPAKAGDPGFVSEFYSNSRLHHLSTWGAEFRAYVNKLQTEGDTTFPGRQALQELTISESETRLGEKSSGKPTRVIMHIDMDCFFVSVGLRNRPALKGKPIAVTHSRGKGEGSKRPQESVAYEQSYYQQRRSKKVAKSAGARRQLDLADEGVAELTDSSEGEDERNSESGSSPSTEFHSLAEIASCSYEARKAGVKNGMFMGQARKLCPGLQTIPYDFQGYSQVSHCLYDTVASYTHDIEAVSCDEMLVDCTDLLAATGASPQQLASLLRQQIEQKTGCTASAGLASNILLAKLATRKAKPNGQFYLHSFDVDDFMKDITVSSLPGVGWSLTSKLRSLSVSTCQQLQKLPLASLQKEFGPKTGQMLYNYSRGQDNRPIKMEKIRKSVSAEINYGIRFKEDSEVEKFLGELSEEVCSRLKRVNLKARTVTLKLMFRKEGAPVETAKFMGHGVCDHIAKSVTIPLATDGPEQIHKECCSILQGQNISACDMRGIGIQLSRLEAPPDQTSMSTGTQSILNFTTKTGKPNSAPAAEAVGRSRNEASSGGGVQQTTSSSGCEITPAKKLPPLPRLPDFTSPLQGAGHSPRLPVTMGTKVNTQPGIPVTGQATIAAHKDVSVKSPGQNTWEDLYVPSPSQLDPEVIQHLPADIQREIQRANSKRAVCTVPKTGDCHPQHDRQSVPQGVSSGVPGCSHWSLSQTDTDQQNHGHTRQDPVVSLPNYSQLDPSCLEALPDDVRAELEDAYRGSTGTRLQQKAGSVPQVHPLMLPQNRSSPTKLPAAKSPGKRRTPHKRGRPPGGKNKRVSPRKPDLLTRTQHSTSCTAPVDAVDIGTVIPPPVAPPSEHTDRLTSDPETVSLCGAVSLADVRSLLKDWVSSCVAPQNEDIERFLCYLSALAQNKDLEKVDLLLKSMHRLVAKCESLDWEAGLRGIVSEIQVVVQSLYGGSLKLTGVERHYQ